MAYDEVTAQLVRENRELRSLLTEARADCACGVQGLGDGAERRVEAFIEKRRQERADGVTGHQANGGSDGV